MTENKNSSEPDLSVLRMNREERPPRSGPRAWVIAILLLAVAGAAAFAVRLIVRVAPVETVRAQIVGPAEAASVLTATGYTYARERAAVGAKIIGRVEQLRVDEGDRVAAGDTIAVLDSDDLRAAVRQREAELLQARATLADATRQEDRLRRLLAENAIAQAEYDAEATRREVAAAQVALAEANLTNARVRLGYAVIRAPIPGVVIERLVEVGELVSPGGFTSQRATGAIVRIANPATLEIEADINEAYLSRLEIGQPATIRVDAVPGRDYRGRLRQIVPTADRQRAVVEVKVTIDDPDERLLPDMSCNVTFLESEEAASGTLAEGHVVVPALAIGGDPSGSFVYRVVDGRLRRTPVVTGGERDGQVVVTEGLDGGELLVRVIDESLEDGQRVRVMER